MKRGLAGLTLVIIGTILFLEGLWALDFAMWYRHFYVYYPWNWNTCYGCKDGKPLGEGVNIKYYQMCIALALACVGSYLIGSQRTVCPREKQCR